MYCSASQGIASFELGLAHRRQRQALDDDGVAGEGGGDARASSSGTSRELLTASLTSGRLERRRRPACCRRAAASRRRPRATSRAPRLEHDGFDGARTDVERQQWVDERRNEDHERQPVGQA